MGIALLAWFGDPIACCGVNPLFRGGASFTGPVSWRLTARPVKPPSRRGDEPPSVRAPGSQARLAHADNNAHSERTQRNAMSIRRCVPPFASSRRPLLTHALDHSQWPEPPSFAGANTAVRLGPESHRPLGTRLLCRCRRARAVHDSPSDMRPHIAACHRAVLRGTHSPVNRRATRAAQARAVPAMAPAGAHVSQPAPKNAPKANQAPATSPRSAWGCMAQ